MFPRAALKMPQQWQLAETGVTEGAFRQQDLPEQDSASRDLEHDELKSALQNRHCERSEAIQFSRRRLDCFVAELVIGPATSGRTRWLLAMTVT
jgi:hypothetical protein